ncbi:PREDICTED: pyrroline-5-carboxylate reductase 2 [Dufourea novaeangliae]|uniref:Pyrroline-5-carboxylate reductase n=1 Tax=Dufourea novaeangliae TaxID=178035 RepID=A0A154PDA8_DUFNO|nr:PREDICTED: pyrroline-5-carboxylate reductase 2 [Dufourea novaeangliae]KZC09896.1 Pyrroline-5-carboxylate reductase 2 [Dufourea novaeangliae]
MAKYNFESTKIGFIGGGNMASAIGAGLIRKGILKANNVWVSARTNRTLGFWSDLGAHATLKNGEVFDNCDVIFLAMKPHMLEDALDSLNATRSHKHSPLFVSVLVGIPLDSLAYKLRHIVEHPRIIRCMPNTPMMVGEGITVYCSLNTTNGDVDMIETLLSYIGVAESIPESLMNAVGGLSGSGPAYAYLVIEALADGAVKMGVPRPMATKFAAQVLVGAGKMVLETGRHPGQLKDEVCSPGGTTITGIHAMECGQVRASMMNAVEAAVKKSNELSSKTK